VRPNLFSPALPAAVLLFGMVFGLAFASFLGLRWQPFATITLYSALFIWVALLAWRQRKLWGRFSVIDVLFGAFIFLVLASLLIHGVTWSGPWKYGRYLPFMVVVPYVCGRLIRAKDIQVFFSVVASAALVMLILVAIDYWQNATLYNTYGRWPFFGHFYSPLLIGALLAGSLIVFSFRFLIGGADMSQTLLRQAVGLIVLGFVTVALVWVAARGALLSGLLGIICMALIVRNMSISRRYALLLYLAVIIGLATFLLPKPQAQLYVNLLTMPDSIYVSVSEPAARGSEPASWISELASWISELAARGSEPLAQQSEPILGKASCGPLEQGINSVAIRWVLYQEAVAMFMNSPWWGVGAASFGQHSCSGEMGYPHSSVLQAFSELGVFGGLLFVGLMLTTFVRIFQKAVNINSTHFTQIAQQALAWFMMYLAACQISGNYFTDVGTYLLAGLAAGMQSNSAWDEGVERSNVA